MLANNCETVKLSDHIFSKLIQFSNQHETQLSKSVSPKMVGSYLVLPFVP